MQLTAPALLGEYGNRIRKTAEVLLRCGVYRLAASDRHDSGPGRSLADLHLRITELAGKTAADRLLLENPRRLLNDEPLLAVEVETPARPSLLGRLLGREV